MARSRIEVAGVLVVAIVSPFERLLPLPLPGGLRLSTVEAAVIACLLLFVALHAGHAAVHWRSPITAPGLVLLGLVAVAAIAAPEHQAHALRFVGRLCAAGLIYLTTLNLLTTRSRAEALVDVLLGAGAIVGLLAVLEGARVPFVMDGLRLFRPGFHVVGGQVRATSTLIYPTIASMWLEVVFALGLARLLQPGRRPRLWALASMSLVGAGVIATFTRAGLASLALTLLVGGVAALTVRGPRSLAPVAALALVLVALVRLSWSPDLLRTRFATDTAQAWYGARYAAPATLALHTGRLERVPVVVENLGKTTWRSDIEPPFALSYHWLDARGEEVLQYDGLRTAFASAVRPGERARVDAIIRAPARPGDYVLLWDVVQEHRTWLSVEGVTPARSVVVVSGPAGSETMSSPVDRLPGASNRVPRLRLWHAALQLARDRPLLGIGPDNFRYVYGSRLGLSEWDTRVHTNNLYLETLVGAGVPALAALIWLLGAAGLAVARAWQQVAPVCVPLLAAVTAAWLSIAGHGLVDTFLAFTPTYVVFALVAGLTFSPALTAAGAPHADRV